MPESMWKTFRTWKAILSKLEYENRVNGYICCLKACGLVDHSEAYRILTTAFAEKGDF